VESVDPTVVSEADIKPEIGIQYKRTPSSKFGCTDSFHQIMIVVQILYRMSVAITRQSANSHPCCIL